MKEFKLTKMISNLLIVISFLIQNILISGINKNK